MRHALGDEAGFFAEFAPRHFFNVNVWRFPAALRELEKCFLHRIAKLPDEPEEVAFGRVFDGDNDAGGVFVHDAVEAAAAVAALDDVFANAGPGIAVDFAAADGLDGHGASA